jgi:hypothetical protein
MPSGQDFDNEENVVREGDFYQTRPCRMATWWT